MTPKEVTKLESEFEINFPSQYSNILVRGVGHESYVVDCVYDDLRESNLFPRKEGVFWSLPWKNDYWIIGGDGAGGFYLLDTSTQDDQIYYFDHEDCGISLDDERVTSQTLEELIKEDIRLAKECEEEARIAMKIREQKIQNRRWWQFWIPKINP